MSGLKAWRPRGRRQAARWPGAQAGFTLVELVISSSLMAMILVSAYLCLQAAISSQRLIEPRVEVIQTARVVLALMTADLRCACPLSKDSEFLGMHRLLGEVEADNLDFATHNYTPRRAREGDFCEVSFFLDQDPETGQLSLWRRRNPTIAPEPLSGGGREELAQGVAGLRFEYSDGYEWYDTWGDVEGHGKQQFSFRYHGNLSGMPEAVRITLWLDANPRAKTAAQAQTGTNEPPLVFQTVARLNLAAGLQESLASGASAEGSSPTGNPASPAGTTPGGNP
ncbi:MAG: prepilin-type N-terminal cleavage/methylation domain-containing protein [Verrucomicrobiota bacterium]|jgi:prepilin-type N-terminal cleavage/methylation domain-containing protein